jgi:hypothetical protein
MGVAPVILVLSNRPAPSALLPAPRRCRDRAEPVLTPCAPTASAPPAFGTSSTRWVRRRRARPPRPCAPAPGTPRPDNPPRRRATGEVLWAPRANTMAALIAPEGTEGTFFSLANIPQVAAPSPLTVPSSHLISPSHPTVPSHHVIIPSSHLTVPSRPIPSHRLISQSHHIASHRIASQHQLTVSYHSLN